MDRDRLFLRDILAAAEAIATFITGHTEESFVADDMCRSAVLQKLHIIDEASKNLSDELKARHPHVPWRRMTGLRNVVAHRYFSIDWTQIWNTSRNQVPTTRTEFAEILATEFPDSA